VGERLLVAGHPGVEDHLAAGLALGAVRGPAEHPAVFQNEQSRGHWSFPSRTVGLPRRNVATTRPGSSSPANGVLRLLDVMADGSTARRGDGSYSVMLAGEPSSTGRPCPDSRPMRAGAADMRSATPAQSSSPVSTMASCTTGSAVSSPIIPIAATAHSVSL